MTTDLEVAARPAQSSDLPLLATIRQGQLDAVADHRGGGLLGEKDRAVNGPDSLTRLELASSDAEYELIVGTLDGYPFGYGLLAIEELSDGRTLGVIEDLVVEPDARDVGLGEEIMNAVVDRARARGCFGVDSRALPGDRETKNFFESFGLKARLLVVHRTLD